MLSNNSDTIELLISTGISKESIKNLHISDITFLPELIDTYQLSRVKFKGICLEQDSVSFLHKKIVNLYVSYTLDLWSGGLNTDFTLDNCIFGAVELTKNSNPDKCKYSGYTMGFNSRSRFL